MILNQFGKPIKKDLSYLMLERLGEIAGRMIVRDEDRVEQFASMSRAGAVRQITEEVCRKKFPGGKGGTIRFRRPKPFTVKETLTP